MREDRERRRRQCDTNAKCKRDVAAELTDQQLLDAVGDADGAQPSGSAAGVDASGSRVLGKGAGAGTGSSCSSAAGATTTTATSGGVEGQGYAQGESNGKAEGAGGKRDDDEEKAKVAPKAVFSVRPAYHRQLAIDETAEEGGSNKRDSNDDGRAPLNALGVDLIWSNSGTTKLVRRPTRTRRSAASSSTAGPAPKRKRVSAKSAESGSR